MPSLPAPVEEQVLRALRAADDQETSIACVRPVGGGCINDSVRLETTGGESYFLKWNADRPGLFSAEADGLRALQGATVLRVPEVAGVGTGEDGSPGWLLLEFISEGRTGPAYGETLGRGLARLHRTSGESWGWDEDNYIGSLRQTNGPRGTWSEYWIEERLRPQLQRARRGGLLEGDERNWNRLFARMDDLVGPAEDEGPSLLHGDLWSGNVYPGPEGQPVLIDPAVYRGHREVDLAMTELFGGFPEAFYDAYDEAWPLATGYARTRRHLYQLYPLLVHVNLFGSGYAERTRRALERTLS